MSGQMESAQPGPSQRSLPTPILIGISGKRVFDKANVQRDREVHEWVADRVRSLFQELDDAFPRTPKIVLSGVAFGGADLIAVEAALQFKPERNWRVAALLPFGRALFEDDFRPPDDGQADPARRDRYAEHARTFARVLADPRVIVRELPPLKAAAGIGGVHQLSHDGDHYGKVIRRNHYEQVGQYIAEAATIMIRS